MCRHAKSLEGAARSHVPIFLYCLPRDSFSFSANVTHQPHRFTHPSPTHRILPLDRFGHSIFFVKHKFRPHFTDKCDHSHQLINNNMKLQSKGMKTHLFFYYLKRHLLNFSISDEFLTYVYQDTRSTRNVFLEE